MTVEPAMEEARTTSHGLIPVSYCCLGGCPGFVPNLGELIVAFALAGVVAAVWLGVRRRKARRRKPAGGA